MSLAGRRFSRRFAIVASLASLLTLECDNSEEGVYYSAPTQPVVNTTQRSNNPPETFIDRTYFTQEGKEFVIEFSGRDNDPGDRVARFEYRIDNDPWRSYTENRLVLATAFYDKGVHTVEFRAIDTSGVPDPTPSRVTFQGIKEESVLATTTNSNGVGNLVVNGKEIDVRTVDSDSRAPIGSIGIEAVSYGNVIGTISKDPLGRYWPLIWPVRISGRGKTLADIVLEVEMQKISGDRPYTIYTSEPLFDSETKLYLRYVNTTILEFMTGYFKKRDELGRAIEIAEFINTYGGFQGEKQITLATDLNKFRSDYIMHLPDIINKIASLVGVTASPYAIYCDVYEQTSFVGTNTVSFDFNGNYTTMLGRVTSQDGAPISGATISQIQPPGPSSSTNSKGEYSMFYVRTGYKLRLKVESPGFETIVNDGDLLPGLWDLKRNDYVMQKTRSPETLKTITLQPKDGKDTRIVKFVCPPCRDQILFFEWPNRDDAFVGRDEEDQIIYNINRAYIAFDMSRVQGLNIQQAFLELYGTMRSNIWGGIVGNIGVRRVSSGWTENGLEWNNQPSFESLVQDAINIDSGYKWRRWDVSSAAISWMSGFANNGLVLISSDENTEGYFDFLTSDSPDSQHLPRIVIFYSE
ncbi:carboxypeptidase regulatory-like domain-containing protein [Candidatus Woesearchaeota archaeon]|nr:carboxypeptidase regulatory-like domain-containing protein [Candidatus Woesearchaeota archaeon]